MKFKGYGDNVLTFKCSNTTHAGDAVKMESSGKITATSDGNTFIGICTNVRNDYAGVQLNGYVEMKYSGTAPTLGYSKLVAAGPNTVKTASAGRDYLVINIDTASSTVGFIL